MRTTVNIDDHLLEETKILAAREHRSVSDIVQDSLRLYHGRSAHIARPSVELPVSHGRLLIDLNDKEAVADALGENEWPRADR